MQRILVLISLFFSYNLLAAQPITGSWQIVSYQIIGYPAMEETERNSWLGNIIQFDQQIVLTDGKTSQTCPEFTYKVTTENSEAQFLTGYNVKPYKLGITEETIQLVEITCNTNSWLIKPRWFTKVSDIHILGYWDGVLFFLVKQVSTNLLLITPQSIGMVNSKSLFSQLTKSLPQYTFDKEVNKFYQQNKLMLEAYPNHSKGIDYINIFDNDAIAPANAKIGMGYAEVFKNSEILVDCEAGVRELVGKTICSFKDIPTVKYVFAPKVEVSPIEALEQAKLIEFIWIADSSLMEEEQLPDFSIPTIIPPTEVTNNTDSFENQAERLADIKNRINILLEEINSQNKIFATAILDLNDAQQIWTQYSYKHCQWYLTFLGLEEEICMEKMAQERADEIELILQELEQLPIVPLMQ